MTNMTSFKPYWLKDINASSIGKADVPRNEIFEKIFETMHVKILGNTKCYLSEDNRGEVRAGGWDEGSVGIIVGGEGVIFASTNF